MCEGNGSSLGETVDYNSNSIDHPKIKNMAQTSNDISSPSAAGGDIEENLYKHNEFFKKMIDLVPAHFYFDAETREKLEKSANSEEGNVHSLYSA